MIKRHYGLLFLTLVMTSIAAPFSTGQNAQRSTSPTEVIQEFRFDVRANKYIVLPVRMGQNTYRFLLDTGSSAHVFDTSLKAELGPLRKQAHVQTFDGEAEVEAYDAPEAFLGQFNLRTTEKVFCMDLRSASNKIGTEIKGLLECPF